MKHFKLLSFLVVVLSIGFIGEMRDGVQAQSVRIDSIGGYNALPGVSNGRWTGQPDNAPRSASNQYKGFLAVDSWAWDNTSPSTWTIAGSGFGNSRGSVSFDAGVAGPLPISVVSISSWTNSQIRVVVAGHWSFSAYRNIKIVVRTAGGGVGYKVENIVAVPKGRGYGQCTWEVFFRRKNAGLLPPPSAYPAATSIGPNYVPRQWDVLFWSNLHTGIITSVPQVSRSADGRTVTYTFILTERNAAWDERMTTRSSQFSIRNGAVAQGILSNISNTRWASSYWR